MRKPFNLDRRGFLGTTAMTRAAAPFHTQCGNRSTSIAAAFSVPQP